MRRWSVWTILIFVGASIVVAGLYHQWQRTRTVENSEDTQSRAPSSVSEQFQTLWRKGQKVQRRWNNADVKAVQEASRCQCTREAPENLAFRYETESECAGEGRASGALERAPVSFREVRTRAPVDFPRLCLGYVLRNPPEAEAAAGCTGAGPLCVSEEAVNVVFNFLGDLSTCLDLSARDLIVIGEMPEASWKEAAARAPTQLKAISESESAACQRLAPLLKFESGPLTCRSLAEGSPLRRYFLKAVKIQDDLEIARQAIRELKIETHLRGAGLENVEEEAIEQWVVHLGFRTGPLSAAIYLKNYLAERTEARKAGEPSLKSEDLDLNVRPPMNRGPASEAPEKFDPKSFAVYLSRHAAPEVIDSLRRAADYRQQLNQVFKEGTCAPESSWSSSW